MSKKEKLKAQKEKQTIRQKELEEEERLEKLEAKEKQSKAAAKMLKKSKREPVICLVLKILMLIPYGYSVFFYGGVTVTGIFLKYIEPVPPKWVAYVMIAGAVLIGAGIIFSFFKKYIVSFILLCGGTFSFLKGGFYMINKIRSKLENSAVEPSLEHMDKEYMRYYYPAASIAVIALILLIIALFRKARNQKRIQHEKDTAPVKSIIE